MELNNLIKKYIKHPITWYFLLSSFGVFLFSFLLIWFDVYNVLYGWMVGMAIAILFLIISDFFNNRMANKENSSLKWNAHIQLLIKVIIFGAIFIAIMLTNDGPTSWKKFNNPVSGLMIIINYSLYNFFYIWKFK